MQNGARPNFTTFQLANRVVHGARRIIGAALDCLEDEPNVPVALRDAQASNRSSPGAVVAETSSVPVEMWQG